MIFTLIIYIFRFYLYFNITGHLLQLNKLDIDKGTCEAILRWSHPTVDFDLITDYIVTRYSLGNNKILLEDTASVGIVTQYNTKCILQPGRLYDFSIGQNVSLTDPYETFWFSTFRYIIMGKNGYILVIL